MEWQDEDHRTPGVAPVKSAARALDLLEHIAAHGPATRAQLSLRLGIPKSSLHAVLATMTARGWLELDAAGGEYRLGFRSLTVSSAYVGTDPVLERAAPLLDEVAAATGETVHLGRLDGAHVIYLDKREAVRPVPMVSAVGRRVPACSTSLGRALIATRPGPARSDLVPDRIVALTPRTTTDRVAVLNAIEQAARAGYAVENEEACLGVRCFGVVLPLADRTGAAQPGAADIAISVSVPLARLDRARHQLVVSTLLRSAARVPHDPSRRRTASR